MRSPSGPILLAGLLIVALPSMSRAADVSAGAAWDSVAAVHFWADGNLADVVTGLRAAADAAR